MSDGSIREIDPSRDIEMVDAISSDINQDVIRDCTTAPILSGASPLKPRSGKRAAVPTVDTSFDGLASVLNPSSDRVRVSPTHSDSPRSLHRSSGSGPPKVDADGDVLMEDIEYVSLEAPAIDRYHSNANITSEIFSGFAVQVHQSDDFFHGPRLHGMNSMDLMIEDDAHLVDRSADIASIGS